MKEKQALSRKRAQKLYSSLLKSNLKIVRICKLAGMSGPYLRWRVNSGRLDKTEVVKIVMALRVIQGDMDNLIQDTESLV